MPVTELPPPTQTCCSGIPAEPKIQLQEEAWPETEIQYKMKILEIYFYCDVINAT